MDNDDDDQSNVDQDTGTDPGKSDNINEKRIIVRNGPLPSGLIDQEADEAESSDFECPVCLQTASFPVELPCRHIFCFLCVKGVANRSKRCALCRQNIPADFFKDPKLLFKDEIKEKSLCIYDEGYQWFYEGRNGWWQYDERTSNELEAKYKNGDKMFELLIAGFLYVMDLENMRQFRRNDQTRRRRIRRDLRNIPGVKGIAGLQYTESQSVRPGGDGGEASQGDSAAGTSTANSTATAPWHHSILPSNSVDNTAGTNDDNYLTPPAPNNTPQTPMTPADSQPSSLSGSQEDLTYHLHNLHIHSNANSSSSPIQDGHANANSDVQQQVGLPDCNIPSSSRSLSPSHPSSPLSHQLHHSTSDYESDDDDGQRQLNYEPSDPSVDDEEEEDTHRNSDDDVSDSIPFETFI